MNSRCSIRSWISSKLSHDAAPWVFVIAGLLSVTNARAESVAWISNANGEWGNAVNWSTGKVPGESSGTTNSDTVSFYRSKLSGSCEVTLSGERNLRGITFRNDKSSAYGYRLASGTLNLARGGVISNLGEFGGVNTLGLTLRILGDYTIDNSATGRASTLFIPGSITTAPQLGSVALTLTGSFGGGNTVGLITGNITEATGTKLTVVKGGKGGWQLNGSNNFTGGLLVDSGSLNLSASGSALGKGSVTLGSAATGADAEINVGSYQTYYNALTIAAGQGTRRLVHLGSAWGIYAGSITMGKDLEIVNATGSGFHIGGKSAGVSGVGNLNVVVNGKGALVFRGMVDVAGVVNHTGSGEGDVVFDGMLGAEVKGVIQRSLTSGLFLNAPNVHGRTDVMEGTVVVGPKGTLGLGDVMIGGRGNLLLGNAQALADGAVLVLATGARVSLPVGKQVVKQIALAAGAISPAGVFSADQLNKFAGWPAFGGEGKWEVREGPR